MLILIMKADLVTKDEEVEFLDRVFEEFELSIDEFDHMENIDADNLIKEYALLPCDTKIYARKLFLKWHNAMALLIQGNFLLLTNQHNMPANKP